MALKAKDIAEMLGVSTATVSLVLNNKPGVGEKKRQEIINKIRELDCDYMLKTVPVNHGNIGFVVYKTYGSIIDESPFFNYILEGINHKILESGYRLTFIYLTNKMSVEEQAAHLHAMNCSGLIIFGVEMTRVDLQVFVDSQIPFVVLDNSFEDSDVDSVAINNAQGTSKAVQYLYSMGHREIGYIHCTERIVSFHERFRAFERNLRHLGLRLHEEFVYDVGYSEISVRENMKKYLQNADRLPTAMFAENDFLACHAVLAMQDMGLRIPEDVSVIGFDDRPICQMITPKISTISVPKTIFGGTAVGLLLEKIETPREQSIKTLIGTKLIIRESVKKIN